MIIPRKAQRYKANFSVNTTLDCICAVAYITNSACADPIVDVSGQSVGHCCELPEILVYMLLSMHSPVGVELLQCYVGFFLFTGVADHRTTVFGSVRSRRLCRVQCS